MHPRRQLTVAAVCCLHPRLSTHLPAPPAEIYPRVRVHLVFVNLPLQLLHTDANGGGQTGRLGKILVKAYHAVQRHQPAHGSAPDHGAFPEGNGAVLPVYHGL